MADTVSKKRRSQIMSAVRSKNNRSTEMRFLSLLKTQKITGWRRHFDLIGRPDFVWKKSKIAVFIDGCFWHGCKSCYRQPKSNVDFWKKKIQANKKRDALVSKTLRKKGWTVIRLKECALKNNSKSSLLVKRIFDLVQGE